MVKREPFLGAEHAAIDFEGVRLRRAPGGRQIELRVAGARLRAAQLNRQRAAAERRDVRVQDAEIVAGRDGAIPPPPGHLPGFLDGLDLLVAASSRIVPVPLSPAAANEDARPVQHTIHDETAACRPPSADRARCSPRESIRPCPL